LIEIGIAWKLFQTTNTKNSTLFTKKFILFLSGLLVHGVLIAEGAEFFICYPVLMFLFILGKSVITLFAIFTR